MSTPDDFFVEPVLGYRAWQVYDYRIELYTWTARGPWLPGVNRAICLAKGAADQHQAPAPGCACGLYALHDPHDHRLDRSRYLIGSIAAWGDLEVYTTGFRAEYARVTSLVRPEVPGPLSGDLIEITERYDVPFVVDEELEATAQRYAAPLPPSVLPKPV